jgi:hypothetical protein
VNACGAQVVRDCVVSYERNGMGIFLGGGARTWVEGAFRQIFIFHFSEVCCVEIRSLVSQARAVVPLHVLAV